VRFGSGWRVADCFGYSGDPEGALWVGFGEQCSGQLDPGFRGPSGWSGEKSIEGVTCTCCTSSRYGDSSCAARIPADRAIACWAAGTLASDATPHSDEKSPNTG